MPRKGGCLIHIKVSWAMEAHLMASILALPLLDGSLITTCRLWAAKLREWLLPSHKADPGLGLTRPLPQLRGLWGARGASQTLHVASGATARLQKLQWVPNSGKVLTKFSFSNRGGTFKASFEILYLESFRFLVFWGGACIRLKQRITIYPSKDYRGKQLFCFL